MIKVQEWELNRFQGPAVQMCQNLCADAYDDVSLPFTVGSVNVGPLWMLYAMRMHEHHLMLQALTSYGMIA